jgi:hypothetical protein
VSANDHDRLQRWVSLPRPAEEVWTAIGGFGRMSDWHPWIERTELLEIDGLPHRHLILMDGELFLERLLVERGLYYTYSTLQGPLPFDDHRATLSCVPERDGCHVFWSAYFVATDPAADEMVLGFYEAGLEALRERFPPPG